MWHSRADPLPCLYTRSIGQPQLMSTKSRLPAQTLLMISAAGTRSWGLLPAICMPKIFSEGWRLTSDHSSFEPWRKEFASPTDSYSQESPSRRWDAIRTFSAGNVGTIVYTKTAEWLMNELKWTARLLLGVDSPGFQPSSRAPDLIVRIIR